MKHTTKFMLFAVTALAFATAALAPTTAHAQGKNFRAYQSDMKGLLETVDAWTDEVEQELEIIAVKPELARSADFLSLIGRGRGMAADMRGTGQNAPRVLSAKHEAATEGLFTVVEGLGIMADGGTAAAIEYGSQQVNDGLSSYSKAVRPVRYFASRAR